MARILIVDDDFEMLNALEEYLDNKGHEVRTARDGVEAFQKSSTWEPEIILLDFVMPGLNGAEFLRAFKEFPSKTSVIVVTAHLDPDMARYFLELGAREFIKKPIDLEYLDLAISIELALRELVEPFPAIHQA